MKKESHPRRVGIGARVAFAGAASIGVALGGCGVPKQVHCKFVNDVGKASEHYAEAAQQANNPGYEAEASELKKTVEAEKQEYCQ